MYLGNVQRDLKLNLEKGTEVYYSCGATLNGQQWIIGGMREKRQVSDEPDKPREVKNCCLDKSNRWMQYQKSWKLGF